MFIVMHQYTGSNSLYVKTYLAINLILILFAQTVKDADGEVIKCITSIDTPCRGRSQRTVARMCQPWE